MNKTMNGNDLDKAIVDAVLGMLNENGVRFDTGDMGETFIHLDGVKETWCLPAVHKCEEYEAADADEVSTNNVIRELDTDNKFGYLMEVLRDGSERFEQCEIANAFYCNVYDQGEGVISDWEHGEVHIGMFKDYPRAWGDTDGCDWVDRMGISSDWDYTHPTEMKGYSKSMGAFYRISKVRLGALSDKFKKFLADHPSVPVTENKGIFQN